VIQKVDTLLSDGIRMSVAFCPARMKFLPSAVMNGPRLVGTHGSAVGMALGQDAEVVDELVAVSTASSRKKQWPTVLKVTLFSTRRLLVPCTVTQRL
jgi:hypothetical protein